MKLVSMKMSKKEAKQETGSISTKDDDLPRYPYELRIRLDSETLGKLKLDIEKYGVGDKCRIEAVGEVIGVEKIERQNGRDREELEIQIVELAIAGDKSEAKEKAKSDHVARLAGPTKEAVYAE